MTTVSQWWMVLVKSLTGLTCYKYVNCHRTQKEKEKAYATSKYKRTHRSYRSWYQTCIPEQPRAYTSRMRHDIPLQNTSLYYLSNKGMQNEDRYAGTDSIGIPGID